MAPVSTLRLSLLRAAYLVIALGLLLTIGPLVVAAPPDLEHGRSVIRALLVALGLLALVGLRHPLRMLPLLFFELAWKILWLVAFGLPRRAAGTLEPAYAQTLFDTSMGVVLCVVAIPWGYVWREWVRAPGEAWRGPVVANEPAG